MPAGQEPPAPDAAPTPAAGERGAIRKRIRRLRRSREVLLRELGALIVELRRLERENPSLVTLKVTEVSAIDEQLRGLEAALGERQTVEQVVAAGVAGSCARCGTLIATDDRFCPHCGQAVTKRAEAPAPAPLASAPPPPPPPPRPPPAESSASELTAHAQPKP